ncbi:hypothetical protein [Bacillus safensis]|uniref:Uncharacterized protein n=1 Tax=Bacillus safensis TaxID=561879 RepID=A0A1L6ZJA5_BACIA|nr:hypothetical protein [Bacillus safensis]APT46601.1 hypothetical protein BSA145_12540 [Bacillus safensis]
MAYSFGEIFETWEILKNGKNGEVFEIVHCALPVHIGLQARVTEETDHRGSFKSLVKAEAKPDDKDSSNLIQMYGCIVTAQWRKVEMYSYSSLSLHLALRMLAAGKTVYVKSKDSSSEYKAVNRYTDFEDIGVLDFDDLANKSFYKKESN